MNRRLSLADRRMLLLTRAAIERVEMRRALDEFRRARRPLAIAAEVLLRARGAGGAGGLVGVLGPLLTGFRQHPYLGSAISLGLAAMRSGGLGRLLRRSALIAALGAAGIWALSASGRASGEAAGVSKPPPD